MLKNDDSTLQQVGIKSGAKVMLIGTNPADIDTNKAAASSSSSGENLDWDKVEKDVPISEQKQHKKMLDKGKPEDTPAGIKDRQMDLPQGQNYIPGLLNNVGTKVRQHVGGLGGRLSLRRLAPPAVLCGPLLICVILCRCCHKQHMQGTAPFL